MPAPPPRTKTQNVNHRWILQSQIDTHDWADHITSSWPMSMDDDEPRRWQSMPMFEGHRWRVVLVVTTTTVETTVVD